MREEYDKLMFNRESWYFVRSIDPIAVATKHVDYFQCENNPDSCGSRAAYGYPPKLASAAHSRSAECFCQRRLHSRFTSLKVK